MKDRGWAQVLSLCEGMTPEPPLSLTSLIQLKVVVLILFVYNKQINK